MTTDPATTPRQPPAESRDHHLHPARAGSNDLHSAADRNDHPRRHRPRCPSRPRPPADLDFVRRTGPKMIS